MKKELQLYERIKSQQGRAYMTKENNRLVNYIYIYECKCSLKIANKLIRKNMVLYFVLREMLSDMLV